MIWLEYFVLGYLSLGFLFWVIALSVIPDEYVMNYGLEYDLSEAAVYRRMLFWSLLLWVWFLLPGNRPLWRGKPEDLAQWQERVKKAQAGFRKARRAPPGWKAPEPKAEKPKAETPNPKAGKKS